MSTWPARLGRSFARGGLVERGGFDPPLAVCVVAALLVRVITDDLSPRLSHHSGAFNLSGAIALGFIFAAIVVLARKGQGLRFALLACSWLILWTAVAVGTRGASAETLREGVREASVLALALLVYNARASITAIRAARLLRLIAVVPAVIAIYQLTSGTGMDIEGVFRANGTLAHPNSAAMFFAMAATASLWLYLDRGRRALDAVSLGLFTIAVLSTYSIDGTVTMLAMFVCFGVLYRGPARLRTVPFVLAGIAAVTFFATPAGSGRLAKESSTSLASAERKAANTSLAWRLYKWKSLIREWEGSPVLGRGLGTTVTSEGTPENELGWQPPHSEYVRYLVETGVIGATILLMSMVALTGGLVRRRRVATTHDAQAANAISAAIAIVFGCLVNSLADNTLLNSPTGYAAALIVAAAVSAPLARAASTPALVA